MHNTCIAVVDAFAARLFTYERTSEVEGLTERLIEEQDLVNPRRRLPHGHDDHRDARVEELDTEFSRSVVEQLAELVRSRRSNKLIICASPKMLGHLRDIGEPLYSGPLAVEELPRDLVKLTPHQLREQLAQRGLLPAVIARARA